MSSQAKDKRFIRDLNVATVAATIRRHEPIPRVELAERTELSRSTITTIINLLLEQDLVREVGEAESTGGRRPVLLELAAGARLVLSVRLGPRAVTMGLCDLRGSIVVRQRRGLRGDTADTAGVLAQTLTWLEEMMKEARIDPGRLIGAGVVVDGVVDSTRGTVVLAPGLGWRDVSVGESLRKRLQIPVLLARAADAFTLGEGGAAANDLLAVSFGSSISAGLIIEGELRRGIHALAGDIGHVTVEPGGPICHCGNRGCLEALAGDAGLVRQMSSALERGQGSLVREMVEGRLSAVTREVVVAAAQDGDPLARKVLREAGILAGKVIAHTVSALDPGLVIIGGETAEQAGPLLVDPIREAALESIAPWTRASLRIEPARRGEAAWIAGAAELVLQRVFRPPGAGTGDPADGLSIARWISAGA